MAQRIAQLCVEVGQGLVEQKQVRLHDDGAGERHALLLPARKLARHAAGEAGQGADVERVGDPRLLFGLRHILHAQAEAQILLHRHMGKQGVGLEHHGDVAPLGRQHVDTLPGQADLAAALLADAHEDPQERGFSAARRAEDGHELARFDGERDRMKGAARTVILRDIGDFKHAHGGFPIDRRMFASASTTACGSASATACGVAKPATG